jgi:hypothetical protein
LTELTKFLNYDIWWVCTHVPLFYKGTNSLNFDYWNHVSGDMKLNLLYQNSISRVYQSFIWFLKYDTCGRPGHQTLLPRNTGIKYFYFYFVKIILLVYDSYAGVSLWHLLIYIYCTWFGSFPLLISHYPS